MRRRHSLLVTLLACIALIPAGTRAQSGKPLTIYVVDVEGGNATLFVAPSGQSLLMDTGNGGPAAARDGERILAAVKDAGLTQIDYLITTHWHGDHFGAMEFVASKIPIKHFIDHGVSVEGAPAAAVLVP
jgi:competence protein ComEC